MKTKLVEIKPPKIKLPPIKQTKVCKKCGKRKTVNKFYTTPNTLDGYRGACIDCHKLESKMYYEFKNLNVVRVVEAPAIDRYKLKQTIAISVVVLGIIGCLYILIS